jgi:adenylate kinase family enzyme
MRRIVILGCSGAGKSTFAKTLGAKFGLPVIHLDTLFWQPGWVEPEPEAFRAAVEAAIAGDAWVTDGNYVGRTFDLRLPRADAVIFIHQPRWLCLLRVVSRWLRNIGGDRPDLAPGCPEKIDWPFFQWVWGFERKNQPQILAAAASYPTPITHLRGDAEMKQYLQTAD